MSNIDSLDVMKSASYLISAKIVRSTISTVINLVLISIIARNLGPTGFGLWALTAMFITLSTTSIELVAKSLVHYIGYYSSKNESDTVISIIIMAYFLVFLLSVIFSVILFVFSDTFAQMLSASELGLLIRAGSLIPIVSNLYSLNYVLLQSYNRFSNMSILDILFSVSLPLLTLLCLFTIGMAVVSIVIAQFIVFVILFANSLILAGKIFNNKIRFLTSHLKNRTIFTFFRFKKLWELVVYGFYTSIITFLRFLDNYVIIFFLTLVSLESVGIFSAASGFFIFAWAIFIPKTISAVLFPKFSSLSESNKDKIWNVAVRVFKYSFLLLLFLPLFAHLFSNIFLLIYSTRFLQAIPLLAILGIGFVAQALIRTYSVIFYSLNKVRMWTFLRITSTALLLLSSLTLIPLYGLYGAVWCFTFKYVYELVVSFLYTIKIFEFEFDLKVITIPLLVAVPLVGLSLIVNLFVSTFIARVLFIPFFLIYIIVVLKRGYFDNTDWNTITLIKDIRSLRWMLYIINPLRNFFTRKD